MTAEHPNVPSSSPAGEALVQQIAEAMLRASVEKWSDDEPEADVMFEVIRKSPGVFESYLRGARAVLPLVEAQVEKAEAKVERLADINRELVDTHNTYLKMVVRLEERAEAAEAQVAPLRDERDRLRNFVHAFEDGAVVPIQTALRIDAAESALRQVRELADEWTAEADRLAEFADKHQGYYLGVVGTRRNCRDHLLAILDSARVGAADTQPEGAGERVRKFVVARDAFYGREAGDEDLLDVAPVDDGDGPTLLWSDLRALVNAPPPETYDDRLTDDDPTPTAGSNGDTAPEAGACHHYADFSGECHCNPSPADTATESGEGR